MIKKKSGFILSVLGILSFICSVAYISSCTRPINGNPYTCAGVVCTNGGRCDSGKCVCPTGYEGTYCNQISVAKFYGYWRVYSRVIGSDSPQALGRTKRYDVEIKNTSTLTVFNLLGFDNNKSYDLLHCRLDPANNNKFYFDTTGSINMFYNRFRVRGGTGYLQTTKDSISAEIYVRYLNGSVNWQQDTLQIELKKL
jgi:hypothetical protein